MKVVKELPISIIHSLKLMATPSKRLINSKKEELPVVVSLTSIPSRLKTLHIIIKSVLSQNYRPKKIILWLHNDLRTKLPSTLKKLESAVFEIRYSNLNCSHRKLIHSLELYPKDLIITCDDDLIYRKEWLGLLYREHLKNPTAIIGNRTIHINYDEEGKSLPFKQWRYPTDRPINPKALLPIGAWGIAYPPNSLSEKVLDESLFLKLTPKADDLWFKAMALLKGTLSIQAKNLPREPIPIIGSQKVALKKDNIKKDRNTSQWIALSDYFNLYSLINTTK